MLIDQNTLKGIIHTCIASDLSVYLTIAEGYLNSGIATPEWGYQHWLKEGNRRYNNFYGSDYYQSNGGYVPTYPAIETLKLEDGDSILLENGGLILS
jgi:hypothetical protein